MIKGFGLLLYRCREEPPPFSEPTYKSRQDINSACNSHLDETFSRSTTAQLLSIGQRSWGVDQANALLMSPVLFSVISELSVSKMEREKGKENL